MRFLCLATVLILVGCGGGTSTKAGGGAGQQGVAGRGGGAGQQGAAGQGGTQGGGAGQQGAAGQGGTQGGAGQQGAAGQGGGAGQQGAAGQGGTQGGGAGQQGAAGQGGGAGQQGAAGQKEASEIQGKWLYLGPAEGPHTLEISDGSMTYTDIDGAWSSTWTVKKYDNELHQFQVVFESGTGTYLPNGQDMSGAYVVSAAILTVQLANGLESYPTVQSPGSCTEDSTPIPDCRIYMKQ